MRTLPSAGRRSKKFFRNKIMLEEEKNTKSQCSSGESEHDLAQEQKITEIVEDKSAKKSSDEKQDGQSRHSVMMERLIEKQDKQLAKDKPKTTKKIRVRKDASELVVISRARDLVKYVFNAVKKVPKSERYSFSVRVQGLALDMIECMVRANNIVVKPKKIEQYKKRYEFQEKAMGDLKVLEYIVAIGVEEEFMLLKQYQQIAKQGAEVSILLSKWIESDRRRFLTSYSQ